MRFWWMACEEHSMKAYSQPSSAIWAKSLFRVMGSGVVWSASMARPSMKLQTVEHRPHL